MQWTRRRFLQHVGAGLALGALQAACGRIVDGTHAGTTSTTPQIPPSMPSSSTTLTGRVVRPGDPDWSSACACENGRIARSPSLIVFAGSTLDVQNAIRWARQNDTQLRVRSGRHSYEGYSTGDGALIIDVSGIEGATVSMNGGAASASIGAGLDLISVYSALGRSGVAVPAGSCPTVGIAGLALGGGFGLSSRSLGLTCDSLVGAEVVTAEGDVLEVTEREQPDLFWALRGGGGGSFGVVTRFDFSAHVVSDVTLYHVRWPWAQAAEAIAAWQAWAPTVDDRMVSLLLVPAAPSQYVYSAGQFAGTPDEMQRYLVPLLASGTPIAPTFDVMSFLDAARTFAGLMPTPHMGNLDGIPPPQKFKNTSCFGYSDLPSEGIAALLAQLESAPGPANLVQFDALGGAISRLAPDATAFCHRLARWNLQLQSYWSDPDDEAANRRWIDETRAALAPFTRGAYVNYADADLPDWAQAYFGDNLPRLQHVKAAYDPDDVFHFAQSIPLAK